jgi:uncharacterized protein with ATP-grasp and redox domains
MKSALDCIPCFVGQALNVMRLVTADRQIQEQVLREVLQATSTADLDLPPVRFGQWMHRRIRELLNQGQANFESLSGCAQNIFFLFKVNCAVVARHIGQPVGSLVLHPQRKEHAL